MNNVAANLLTPLKNTAFRRLFSSQVISLLGTGFTSIALALLAFDLDSDAAGAILGTALAIKMIAYLLVAPVVGGLVHRLPRKGLLSLLNLLRMVFLLCLPWADQSWQLFIIIFCLNACAAGYTPVFQALIPDILPDEQEYTQALSLSRLAMETENLISPLLAASLLLSFNYTVLFQINAAAFFSAAVIVLMVSLPVTQVNNRVSGLLHNISYGIRGYLNTPRTRGLLALHFSVASAGAMVIVNTVVYVRDYLQLDENHVALTMAAYGCGAMLCAMLLPSILNVSKDRIVMTAGALLMAVVLLLGSQMLTWYGLLVLWFLLGIGNAAILTPTGRVLRLSSNSHDRSAYFSANFALSHALWLISYLSAGWLGSRYNLPITFIILAVFTITGALLALLLWPAQDKTTLIHTHEMMDHKHLHTHSDDHHQHQHEGWEGPEPHAHEHHHKAIKHKHPFVIDEHHLRWPR